MGQLLSEVRGVIGSLFIGISLFVLVSTSTSIVAVAVNFAVFINVAAVSSFLGTIPQCSTRLVCRGTNIR